jgi:hypothetical protein
VPEGAVITLLRDGHEVARGRSDLSWDVTSAGVYRVEVHVPGWLMPWILTNPIYVFDDQAARARSDRGRWPEEPPAPAPRLVIGDLVSGTDFHIEQDAASRCVSRPSAVPAPGEKGRALELSFSLAAPGPGRPDTWCAVISRQKRDWSGFSGLRFSLRADGQYRIWVQVRDENPVSKEQGLEWWQASVRTETEARTVVLPFSRFRSINPKSDGRLDLDRVQGLVFLIDRGSMKIGSRGTIWLDDLAVF